MTIGSEKNEALEKVLKNREQIQKVANIKLNEIKQKKLRRQDNRNRASNDKITKTEDDSFITPRQRKSGLLSPQPNDPRKSVQILPRGAAKDFASLIEANQNKNTRTRNLRVNQSMMSQKSRESFRSHRGVEKESQGCFKIFKPTADPSVDRSMNRSNQNQSEFD